MIVFSCKKQDTPPIETNYDTIPVNSQYILYGLLENTILTLDASTPDATGYKWTPGDYETASINVDKEGIYVVKVTTHTSIYTCQVTVYYQGSDCYIPSSFTPNGELRPSRTAPPHHFSLSRIVSSVFFPGSGLFLQPVSFANVKVVIISRKRILFAINYKGIIY